MKKVKWGVLSTAGFGIKTFIPALLQSSHAEVVAIASRDLARAQTVAAQFGIAKAYGDYQALLNDPEIEAIYNPLPNDLHVPMTLAAARAGKHVLCEKPIAMNAAEAAALKEFDGKDKNKVQIMEAFMVRFHPQWQRARQIVQSGQLGEVRAIQTHFAYANLNANNIRNKAQNGGGALYDIGCYAIVTGRFLWGAEPKRVVCLIDRDPVFGTDRTVSAILDYGNGRQHSFVISTQLAPCQSVQIMGTKNRLRIEIPFNPLANQPTRLILDSGKDANGTTDLSGAHAVVETLAPANPYTLEVDAFCQAVRGVAPLPFGVDDAIANMKVIDALFKSAQNEAWVNVEKLRTSDV